MNREEYLHLLSDDVRSLVMGFCSWSPSRFLSRPLLFCMDIIKLRPCSRPFKTAKDRSRSFWAINQKKKLVFFLLFMLKTAAMEKKQFTSKPTALKQLISVWINGLPLSIAINVEDQYLKLKMRSYSVNHPSVFGSSKFYSNIPSVPMRVRSEHWNPTLAHLAHRNISFVILKFALWSLHIT